jgi:hypothetical protein
LQKGQCADNSSLLWKKVEKKSGHDNSRPLQKGKWPWQLTPIAKRKMVMVTRAHREKEKELTW